MTEQRSERQGNQEVFVAPIYSRAQDILSGYGKQETTSKGMQTVVSSFFCDEKDRKGYSDINLASDGRDVTIVVLRELPDGTAKRREITLDADRVKSLKVFNGRRQSSSQYTFNPRYQGLFDQSQINLDALDHWLYHVSENVRASGEPCRDDGPLSTTLREREVLKSVITRGH